MLLGTLITLSGAFLGYWLNFHEDPLKFPNEILLSFCAMLFGVILMMIDKMGV